MEELEQYIIENQESFYRLAYTYVKDRDAALDVVQNAVVKALTHWESPIKTMQAQAATQEAIFPREKCRPIFCSRPRRMASWTAGLSSPGISMAS